MLICTEHPADLTKKLGGLVRDGFLLSEGAGRGMVYYLPWQSKREVALFYLPDQMMEPPKQGSIPPELAGKAACSEFII